jgi:hypothetical protein
MDGLKIFDRIMTAVALAFVAALGYTAYLS